jgi:hypothetical protein
MIRRDDLPTVHDALVARLTADVRPVRPLWAARRRLVAWLAVAGATIALAAVAGLRSDLAEQLARPAYVGEVALLVLAGAAAASAALRLAIPGRDARGALASAAALALIAAAASLLEPPAPPSGLLLGLRCAACVAMFGLVPWLALVVAIVRAAPLDVPAAAAAVGAAGFLVGVAAVRVACPFDGAFHLVAWHVVPALGWTVASAALLAPRLRRRLAAVVAR